MYRSMLHCDQCCQIGERDGGMVYQFHNETGSGTLTMYEVFPGVALAYNDFHMRYFDSAFQPGRDVFCIDHCREGRLEYMAKNDAYSYVEAGDLKLDSRLTHTGRFEMPLSHYHGAMVSFDMEIACQSVPLEIKDFPVELQKLRQKFCQDRYPVVLHKACSIEHIFADLYAVPEQIKLPYFKVKILELLLYLEALEFTEPKMEKPYFYKIQVEKTKAIQRFLMEHLAEHFTQAELSQRFEIPLTPMKRCFKAIYGNTIGGWLLQYRMNQAAVMLQQQRKLSITEIAGKVGYDSPSKFSIAFRRVMGLSPTEYRSRRK